LCVEPGVRRGDGVVFEQAAGGVYADTSDVGDEQGRGDGHDDDADPASRVDDGSSARRVAHALFYQKAFTLLRVFGR
jgi:hypothetical protein